MKILISGCSYSYGPFSYGDVLKQMGYDVTNLSFPGQSNNHIIYKIYEYMTKHNIENSFIILQISWLHRFGLYSPYLEKWINYQPNAHNVVPSYDEKLDSINFEVNFKKPFISELFDSKSFFGDKGINEMLEMYSLYLKYHYDEKETFNYLLYQIDTLISYAEKKNNKIHLIYWPLINNDMELNELKKRNVHNLEGEHSILKWSTKFNFINKKSSHLSSDGHKKLAMKLNEVILCEKKIL